MLALADNVAIALGHVRQRAEMESALRQEQARAGLLEAIIGTLDMDEALTRLLRMTCDIIAADAGAISLLTRPARRCAFATPMAWRPPDDPFPSSTLHPARPPAHVREPVLISDYARLPDAHPAWLDTGIRSVLSVPLLSATGTDQQPRPVHPAQGTPPFRQDQLESLQGVWRIASIAIRNARLYANSVRRAEEAQALIGTAHALSSSLDLQTVLHQIAEQARSLLNSDGSRIHLYNPEDNLLPRRRRPSHGTQSR